MGLFSFLIGAAAGAAIATMLGKAKRAEAPSTEGPTETTALTAAPGEAEAPSTGQLPQEAKQALDNAKHRVDEAMAAAREARETTEAELKREFDAARKKTSQ
jgi:hypothetical protein